MLRLTLASPKSHTCSAAGGDDKLITNSPAKLCGVGDQQALVNNLLLDAEFCNTVQLPTDNHALSKALNCCCDTSRISELSLNEAYAGTLCRTERACGCRLRRTTP